MLITDHPLRNAHRIWHPADNGPDSYVCFRTEFDLTEVRNSLRLAVAADSDFALYLNGIRLPVTQFPDFPNRKSWCKVAVAPYLLPGRNAVAVLVHHLGENFSTHQACAPGLLLAIWDEGGPRLASSQNWKCRLSPSFRQHAMEKITRQLGFSFTFDAAREDDWIDPDYDDAGWKNAAEQPFPAPDGSWQHLEPRPIPLLLESPPQPSRLIRQGLLYAAPEGVVCRRELSRREAFPDGHDDESALRPGGAVQLESGGSFHSFRATGDSAATGCYLLIDLGRETVGFLHLQLKAPAGAVVEIHHGEHLDDGYVRSLIGDRRFVDTYLCREGKNYFSYPLRRLGCRYLELRFRNCTEPAIRFAGLEEVRYPFPPAARFHANDHLMLRLLELAEYTLVCCLHDHYEDCPWREQALYAYDSRNQMFFGYYRWGNYQAAAASIELLARAYLGNGYLALCAPAKIPVTIPVFSFSWITESWEYLLFSGDIAPAARHIRLIDKILSLALSRSSRLDGLYDPGEAPELWHFYEWTGELAGGKHFPQSAYNLYLAEALDSAAAIHAELGNRSRSETLQQTAAALKEKIQEHFWDERHECYAFYLPGEHPDQQHYEHIQALMLSLVELPKERRQLVWNRLGGETLAPISFSALPYLLRGAFRADPSARRYFDEKLEKSFAQIAYAGSTTLWETKHGGSDFELAGSLCHGWSAIHTCYCHGLILGIRPLAPGFARFEIKPYPGRLRHAEGTVPTPSGPITVDWMQTEVGLYLEVEAPENLVPTVDVYPEFPIASCRVNGRQMAPPTRNLRGQKNG